MSNVRVFRRLLLLGSVLAIELLAGSVWLDGESLLAKGGLAAWIGYVAPWVLRAGLGFAGVFVAFTYLKYRDRMEKLMVPGDVHRGLLALHAVGLAVFAGLSQTLFFHSADGLGVVAAWLLSGVIAMLLLVRAVLPFSFWLEVRRATGPLWVYGLAGGVLACAAGEANRRLWEPAAGLTFVLVRWILQPIIPDLTVNTGRMLLRGHNFGVVVSPECSGLEGIGLFVVFSLVFLWLFREECRFPQAWLLLPAGVVVLYGLNAVRIASLLLIGEVGFKEIARGGFHSQAGWMSFNLVAFAMAATARRLPWFSQRKRSDASIAADPTAAYLLPFLAVLAAAMIAQAGAGRFEWLYSLRLFAAAITLLGFRRVYRREDWRCGGAGVAAGVLVFTIWICFDRWLGPGTQVAMPEELRKASAGLQVFWLGTRVLAAVVTVPVAEELAFRGFAMRRLEGVEFEQRCYRDAGWIPVLLSSLAFGVLHGSRWVEGILAGLVFAGVARYRNRLGEAVGAHAAANGLLSVYVLLFDAWQFL